MNNANITKRPPNQIEIVKAGLSGIADSIVDALPKTMAKYLTPERIIKMTALEVGRSPSLLRCTLPSILRAAVDASTLGLEIGSTIGQAYLVPFKNSKTGQTEAHLIVGYQGYIALCNRSGDLMDVDAGIVREGDVCEYQRGTKAFLFHRPNMKIDPEDESKWIFTYCVANFTNGGQSITTMTAAEVAKVRKMSRAPAGGPWDKWTDQMWLKSVIRRGRKKWPFSVDIQHAAALENVAESGGHIGLEFDPVIRAGMKAAGELPGSTAVSLTASVPRDKTATLLDDLKAAEADPECQMAADWEGQRHQNAGQATPNGASDTGQPPSTQSDGGSPPDAPDGPESLPPVKLDYDSTFAEGLRLGLEKGRIQRVFEDEGITVRTRSQKKFEAAVREFEQIMGPPAIDIQPHQISPPPGTTMEQVGEQPPASYAVKANTRALAESLGATAPPDGNKSIHVVDQTNGTPDTEPGEVVDAEYIDPDQEPVEPEAIAEMKRLALAHNLAHDEGDMIGLFKWISGNTALATLEAMTKAEAARAMDRMDVMIQRAGQKPKTNDQPPPEQGSLA